MDLSICFVATELFDWGRFGGFGQCTWTIGAALSERSVRVSVVVPRGRGQKTLEELDGMTVHSFLLHEYPFSGHLYRRCDADVYHSEGLSWGSKIAMEAAPGNRHMVTFQNPKTKDEWAPVNRFYHWRRRAFNILFWDALAEAARRMDIGYCQARFVIPKVKAL